ncbi:MAG: response regulator [Alkalimonas sp.]|nr:response regulator [Alkalimonas sp.]
MKSTKATTIWLLSIGFTLLVVMLLSAWLAHQQRLHTFELELKQLHRTNSQQMQQLQLQLQQDALIAADLVHANSHIQKAVLDAASHYRNDPDDAVALERIRQAVLPELKQQWQALQPFAVRQLHLHLAPDALTLLRAHRPERHSDRLQDVRPMVMSVLNEGEAIAALEVGRHGMGVRAVVPVQDAALNTVGAVEVGLGIQTLIFKRQQLLQQQGIVDAGVSVLLSKQISQVIHPSEQSAAVDHSLWVLDSESGNHTQSWLKQGLLPNKVAQPTMLRFQQEQQHFLVSLMPWYSYQQPSEQAADVVLVAWQDITGQIAAHQQQNLRIWGLWLVSALLSVSLIVFFAARLQKATAHSIKAQQLQLRWSEQRLDALFRLSPLPILLNRMEDGAFIESNPAMEKLVGYTQQELSELSYWDLTPEIYADDEQKQLESLQNKGRYGPYRKQYRHKDGHLIDIELNGMRFENPAGEQMIWTIVQDLTERNQLDKMKDEFISTVSHELRTPLTSIAGSLSLVLSGAAGELTEKSKKMLGIAERNSKRLTSLVNDLLDMEKLVAGKLTFMPQQLDLTELLQDAVEQNSPYAQNHQTKLVLESELPAQVLADPARIQQVMANLLSNAVKFSPNGSVVRITTEQRPSTIRINIIDEGPGLTAEEISGLFQRFSQLNSGTTKQQSGTGLGLAICREIIHQSGGQIGVDSQPGQGTCFWFELPLTEHTRPSQHLDAVLIVEDDADIALMLQAMLEQDGYSSDWATDIESAWRLLQCNNYKLITLDLKLKNEHGADFFLRLRDNLPTRDIPVLVISAYIQEGKLQLGAMANAIDWLEKPIQPDALATKLAQLLEQQAWHSEARLLHVEDDNDIVAIVQMHLQSKCRYHQAASLTQARILLRQHRFDLLLLDIGLPDGEGWDLLADVKQLQGDIPVVVFSARESSLLQHGQVSATFAKSRIEPAELAQRIKTILND